MNKEILFKLIREKNIEELNKLYEKEGRIEVSNEEFTEFCVEGNIFAMDQIMLRFDQRYDLFNIFGENPIKENATEEEFMPYVHWLLNNGLIRASIKEHIRCIELLNKYNKQDLMELLLICPFFPKRKEVIQAILDNPLSCRLFILNDYTEAIKLPDNKVSLSQLVKIVNDENLVLTPNSLKKLINFCCAYDHGLVLKIFQRYSALNNDLKGRVILNYIFRGLMIDEKFYEKSKQEMKEILKMKIFTPEWKYYYFHFLFNYHTIDIIEGYLSILEDEGIIREISKSLLQSQQTDKVTTVLLYFVVNFNYVFKTSSTEVMLSKISSDKLVSTLLKKETRMIPSFLNLCFKIILNKTKGEFPLTLLEFCEEKYDLLTSQMKNRIIYSHHIHSWTCFFDKILKEVLFNDEIDLEYILIKLFMLSNFPYIRCILREKTRESKFAIHENDKVFFIRTPSKILFFEKGTTTLFHYMKNILQDFNLPHDEMCSVCHKEDEINKLPCNHAICWFCFTQLTLNRCPICRSEIPVNIMATVPRDYDTFRNEFILRKIDI